MIRKPQFWIALLFLAVFGVAGCVHVKPYQRELLASPVMESDGDPLDAKLDGHVWEYREGSIGGTGVGGGGCGCN